jgi:hypothetical protein
MRESAHFRTDALPEGGAFALAVPSAVARARRHEPYSHLTILAEHKPCDLADVTLFHRNRVSSNVPPALI